MAESDFQDIAADRVQQWTVKTIGNRPIDHLVRDNLIGSTIRDFRAKRLQALWRRPSEWLQSQVQHLPAEMQTQALQLLGLHALTQLGYARWSLPVSDERHPLFERITEESADFNRLLRRISQCRPVGALFQHVDEAETDLGRACKRAAACPWCHARRVARLYRRLAPRLETDNPERWLLQARFKVEDNLFTYDGLRFWARHTRGQPLVRPEHVHAEEDLRRLAMVWYCNEELKQALRDAAKSFGATGGLLTYQLGPCKREDGELAFSHRMGLLSEVEFPSPEAREAFFAHTFRPQTRVSAMGEPVWVDWLAMPASSPLALRFLLAGSSVRYPIDKLTLYGNEKILRDGVPGVLSLEPMYMMTDWRLFVALQITKHQRLYEAFGTWKDQLRETDGQPRTPKPSLANLQQRQKQAYRLRRLTEANELRRKEAEAKRQEPLEVARQVWPAVKQQASGKRGRPANRKLLGDVLKDHGIKCSDRDLRYLMTQLQQEANVCP